MLYRVDCLRGVGGMKMGWGEPNGLVRRRSSVPSANADSPLRYPETRFQRLKAKWVGVLRMMNFLRHDGGLRAFRRFEPTLQRIVFFLGVKF